MVRRAMGKVAYTIKDLPTIQELSPSKIFCNAIVEEKSTGITQAKGAGMWILDSQMQVVWMNEALEEIYGPLEYAKGKNCYAAFRGRSSKCPDCLPTKSFESGNIMTGYVARTTMDGTQRIYQLVETPLLDSENKVANVLEMVLDVTEKARMEQSLKESEREYRALFDHSGTAVAVTTKDGVVRKANQAFELLSGYQKEEIEGKMHYLSFVSTADRDRVQKITAQREKNPAKTPSSYEFTFLTRSGEKRLVQISVGQMPFGNQTSSMIDITEQTKLEQEIRNKEQFLANILRHSMEAIVAMDTKGTIRSWNRGAELMFGHKAKDILGMPFSSLFTKEFRRSKKMREITDLFHRQGYLRNFIADAVTRDGKTITIDITRTVIRNQDGIELGSSAVIRDITVHRRIEQRLIQQEKMLAMGELAGSLAHEIKNPLNSMVINMEVLSGHFSDLPEEKRRQLTKYLDILSSETARLDNVMKNFLDFAKPIEWKFNKLRIVTILKHVIELVSAQADRQKIKFKLHGEDDLPLIEGAEDYLKQVFLNLLLNAMQAMPKGGIVNIAAKREGPGHISITIEDNGVGISRQNFGKIFDLYFSTKEKGSGLGLPLVKRFVTAHGGKIKFVSKVNHGTKFTVTLPTV
jgi:PAS domain S-box-containing protein